MPAIRDWLKYRIDNFNHNVNPLRPEEVRQEQRQENVQEFKDVLKNIFDGE